MHVLKNKIKLLDLIAQGATVITPNNRLSNALMEHYFTHCKSKTVDKPRCLPYRTALIKTYEQFKFQKPQIHHPTLLNDFQCQHLWRIIIKADPDITYSEGLLRSVMEAWKHCEQWQINSENPAFHYTPQTRHFQQWWQQFNKRLQKIHAISEHQLISYLINAKCSLFAQTIIWACFDDFSPQQIKLQQYLTENGLIQYQYDLNENSSTPQVFVAKDTKEEYQQLIAWLHFRIQQGDERIGVVIPNLEQETRALQRILLQHFDLSQFNISLGQPLSKFSLITHALVWLNLDHQHLNVHQATLLLQSPYIGCAKEEFINRSQYLQDSALLQDQTFSLKTLIQDLRHYAPKLSELLGKITPYPKIASPQEWIQILHDRLTVLGFPGDYGLNSENYQCFNRFIALFDEFRQLSLISERFNPKEAIDALIHLLENTIFQAQKINAFIQISGLLEASGCEFDSLWVSGLTDQCLPQKTRLSAFIPPQIQRELLMPHSLPTRELQFANQILQRLERGSAHTVFSYSRLQGDTPNLPSSLITEYPDFERIPLPDEQDSKTDLIELEEHYNVSPKAEEQISGGTVILANQAKCPFKAFAEHRLSAKPPLQTSDGLDSKEKGIITHKIMELVWRALKSQKQLRDMSLNELELHIDQAIQTTLNSIKQQHPDSFPDLIQEVEYTRLKRLVMSCLEWEKQRPDFTIAAIEESYSINLAGMEFKVRVDRLDQVEDRKWVIDYKSSLPTNKPWYEERPKEPQLLLYALLDKEINTLLLMQLKTGKLICSGFSEHKQDIKGISSLKKDECWDNCRTEWQQQLTLLAEEIQNGFCPPQPASTALCDHCDFQNLCRFRVTQ